MRRVGHAGLGCALTMVALLVPHAGRAPAGSPGEAISAQDAGAATSTQPGDVPSTRAQFVTYNGVRVTVPATWPVIDLRVHPQTCVRFDTPVVYLGPAGSQSDCPAHAVGRVDTVWLRTVSAGRKDPLTSHGAKVGALAARVGVNPISHDKQAQFVAQGVELEATWGTDSSSVDQVLASAVVSSSPSTPAPAAPSAAVPAAVPAAAPATVPATSDTLAAGAEPVAFTATTSAIAARSTFTGMAFDTCAAPSASTMSSWLASPYRSAGIYIGGSMRACSDGNLSSTWVAQVRSMGWGLLPIYVGAQAPCVNQSGLATITASQAGAQGTASADDAVTRAQLFDLGSGTPIYYDMEAYSSSAAGCSQTVMTFISAWTAELHRRGYRSGAYGSSASLMVDMSASVASAGFVPPDDVWFAHWNQLQTTSDASSYPGFPDAYWSHHQRLHQYSGGGIQSWGGATVNIDANWVDAAVAGTAVPVDYGTNVVGPGGGGFVFTGSMAYWRSGAPAGLKGLTYWTGSNGSTESNGATWSPQLSPGLYDVEANIPSTNATANAPYTIKDALGTTTTVVNQGPISGYTSLGTHKALAGSPISVHVGDNDPNSTNTQIGVDAMAFRLVATAPSPPAAVSATGGNTQAAISWSAASANGSPVTGYTVTASPGGASANTNGATTATVMSGLTNGTSYTFTVTATNAAGTSPPSAPSNAVTPSAPSKLSHYTPVDPVRLLDTGVGTATNPVRTAVPAGGTVKVAVAGISGSPVPAGATAVALNVTVTAPQTAGFVSAANTVPNGSSTLNFVVGQTVANLVISKIAPDGTVSIYNGSGGTVQLIADVQGYAK
ncbi:MAG: glycoside hydrolase domain-containing protein [Dermatophilaceae bacterium]